ncbi:hypothetical protein SODALDRAFT_360567 [Sodiomyces alkalinus F11]|uniref:Uncharacterized protein n=1 Tax=Sodiomyces alkalinus (strain CBS 110278 / VKM F-3762 / F11) TaxID=1314773 RepID=A0A3N2PUS7_SODAK|nr:hypothetical protein SODALDRAFT_360567 [Sodiomyces alkalinus F11]ROT38224.1 hypothetical protein SODALDRAFT_360567 [Sodiomyces alkalinus F11]
MAISSFVDGRTISMFSMFSMPYNRVTRPVVPTAQLGVSTAWLGSTSKPEQGRKRLTPMEHAAHRSPLTEFETSDHPTP